MARNELKIIVTAKDEASRQLKQLSNEVNGLDRSTSKLDGALSGLGGTLATVGIAAAAAVATGLAVLSVAAIKQADAYEQSSIAFETMLGDADKAQKLLEDLANLAKRTPFEITGIEASAKQLLAMGIEGDRLIPTLKAIGDVSSGLSVDLNRVAYNFGQVKAQGKLTGVELRDFARAGIPLIAELAKNMEVSEAAIKDMVSAGSVGFDEVEKAFTTMTSEGGKFNDLMIRQSGTFSGMVSNMKDNLTLFLRDIGNVMLPVLKQLTEQLMIMAEELRETFGNWLGNWIAEHKDEANEYLLAIKDNLAVLGTAFKALGKIAGAFFTGMSDSMRAWFEENEETVGLFIENLRWFIELHLDLINSMLGTLKVFWSKHGDKVISIVKALGRMIGNIFSGLAGTIMNIMNLIASVVRGDWEGIKTSAVGIVDSMGRLIDGIFAGIPSFVGNALSRTFSVFTDWLNRMLGKAKSIASDIRSSIKSAFDVDAHNSPSIRETVNDMVGVVNSQLASIQTPEPLAHSIGNTTTNTVNINANVKESQDWDTVGSELVFRVKNI